MENINRQPKQGCYNKLKCFDPNDLSVKLLKAMLSHNELSMSIKEFNQKHNYSFYDSLTFQLSWAMVKHCSPTEIIDWKTGVRDKNIINDTDNEKTTRETFSIVNDFLSAESRKAMERILVYEDSEFDGQVFRNSPCHDYSIVCPEDQLESYQSLLFHQENHKCVISYYLDFMSLFPLTLQEFEKILFYFLTFLIKEDNPVNVQINEPLNIRSNINEILRMRYIDIDNRMVLAFLHLISMDKELSECCNAIYKDIKYNYDHTRRQFENLAGR